MSLCVGFIFLNFQPFLSNLDTSNEAAVDLMPGKIGQVGNRSCGEVLLAGEAGLTMRGGNGVLCVEGRKK